MSFLHPHGSKPPSVYWRRRAVVFGGLLVVLLVLVLVAVKPGAGSTAAADNPGAAAGASASAAPRASAAAAPTSAPSAAAAPAPSASASASASAPKASASAGATPACDASQITLKPVADKSSYTSLELPKISMSITNTAASACVIDLGSAQQVLTITSGAEQYWSSKDCQVGGTHQKITMTAGQTLKTPSISWDRTRSSTKTCDSSRSAVPAGGASYHLSVAVGSLKSSTSALMILN